MTDQAQTAERTHRRVINEQDVLSRQMAQIEHSISKEERNVTSLKRTFVNAAAVALFAAGVTAATVKGAYDSFTAPPTKDDVKSFQLEATKKCALTATINNLPTAPENLNVCRKLEEGHIVKEWGDDQFKKGIFYSLAAAFCGVGMIGMGARALRAGAYINGSRHVISDAQNELRVKERQTALLSKILE